MESIGQGIAEALAEALLVIVIVALFAAVVFYGLIVLVVVYLLQLLVFGLWGRTPLLAVILGYMGRHVRGILTVSAAVGALSGIVGFLAYTAE